jgi:hypothetical protein
MTMGLVLGDLRRSEIPPRDWKQSIDLLWGQIQICKHSLSELPLAANVERLGMLRRLSAKELLHDVQIFDRTRGGTGVQIELPISRSNEEKDHEYREPRIASG